MHYLSQQLFVAVSETVDSNRTVYSTMNIHTLWTAQQINFKISILEDGVHNIYSPLCVWIYSFIFILSISGLY